MINRILSLYFLAILFGCQSEPTTQFQSLPTAETGITFNNVIQDHDTLSILSYEYIYNGGGVAIGDLNGDNLQDLVFTGNMVDNAIYLNEGDLKFKDISAASGILTGQRWSSGVTLVDVNVDGLLDIYITATGHDKVVDKTNQLFVNQGTDENGIPSFLEKATEYGIADNSNSTNATFFDYDNDGDLDLFVIVNRMRPDQQPSRYRKKVIDGSSATTDKLYENVWDNALGHPVFKDIGKAAGILTEGFSLGVNICDLNEDGWKDIYITNDYLSNDLLYINNQDGTFTNQADIYFKHTSFSAMGNDVMDLDNDGDSEIIALDMLPKDNYRRKTMMPPNKYVDYINNEKFGYQFQSMRNTLQANRGVSALQDSQAIFNDVGLMAGIAATDWSWTPLVADFDNDGQRDLIVTNGFPKDVTDRDFIDYNMDVGSFAEDGFLIDKIPSVKINNYAFKNNGDLSFADVSKAWGITEPSFSNGAAYGDLDNDGDLDYVVNNINQPASLYENKNLTQTNSLRIQLKGPKTNPLGIGTKVYVYADSLGMQVIDFTLTRGYLSSVEPFLHFGLANQEKVDSVVVIWQDGKREKLNNITANQTLVVLHQSASYPPNNLAKATNTNSLFKEITEVVGVDFIHKELDYIDFNVQPMMPHKLSQYGPALAVSDVNGDGLEDVFISGSHFEKGTFLVQQVNGQFTQEDLIQYGEDKAAIKPEELGALFFDADQDGDNDLYVVHGGYEYVLTDSQYIDRLYTNENGRFVKNPNALPEILSSGLAVKAADFDQDGDLDLFVGGRVNPTKYPTPVDSYILRNESDSNGIRFVDATAEVAPMLTEIGMISDALWTDYNNDGQIDLMLAGEFIPITFLKNTDGKLVTADWQLPTENIGWWNSITSGDFDNDGDIDYIVGNTGRNTNTDISEKHPIKVYYKDFDNNGRGDLFPACYFPDQQGNMQEYPYFGRLEIAKQYNIIPKKFPFHKELAVTTMDKLFTPEEMEGCLILAANNFNTSYIENLGNGQFSLKAMPKSIQRSPIYGMQTMDVNQDGNLDVLMVGNDYGMEVSVGRMDAHDGIVAYGDGQGNFDVQDAGKSGFLVQGDAKALVQLHHAQSGQQIFIASQNRGPLKIFTTGTESKTIDLNESDISALIQLKNGKTRKQEFYYGAGFLSQSSRSVLIDDTIDKVIIMNAKGEKRTIAVGELSMK